MVDLTKLQRNGNTFFTVNRETGTKTRLIPMGGEASPVYPESIDLKITNACHNEHHCPFCHEMSVIGGEHGDLSKLPDFISGTELAIGGGNPLEHPQLEEFLTSQKEKGVICNLTVHLNNAIVYRELLKKLLDNGLINGLGVSVQKGREAHLKRLLVELGNPEHVVVHLVVGVVGLDEIISYGQDHNILLLGYKDWGRGQEYLSDSVTTRITEVLNGLPNRIEELNIVSFDNLALAQLNVEHWVSVEDWRERYMGEDGTFSMYIDAVKQEVASTSYSPKRFELREGYNLIQLFDLVKGGGGEQQ